ncbi:cold-shock protein [Pseudomonas sp. TTU2014-096BSC]|nr:cold-shock protein [Pseudomonas sp. TTU2014-096BSC]
MELRGQLRSWDDQKGFGFIRPERGGGDVFAHISAMRGARRPVQGDRVLYLSEADKAGRLRATHIRLDAPPSLDEPAIRRKPARPVTKSAPRMKSEPRVRRNAPLQQPLLKALGLFLLCLLPALGSLRLAEQGSNWLLLAYPLASLLAFVLYLHDKRSALRDGWRTPESRLHLVELLGGWPGALIAQQWLRHKTRKWSFQLVFWLIVIAHQVVWLDYLYLQRLYRLLPQF